ncbi:tetratricopeptide repeat protein [Candidatus Obscuribacterales bacterium]|nr:tetratricopeptide repeat protein [Candidatus Obscuribacterales bacterium]
MKNSLLLAATLAAIALSAFNGTTQTPAHAAVDTPQVNHQYKVSTNTDATSKASFDSKVQEFIAKNDFAGLLNFCTESIASGNQKAEAFYFRAMSSYNLGADINVVLADLDRSLEVNPKFVAALDARSSINEATGNFRGAIEDYKTLLVIFPDNLNVLSRLTNAHGMLGDWQGVISDCNYWLTLKPHDPDAYYVRAIGYIQLGDVPLAIADLKHSSELLAQLNRQDEAAQVAALIAQLESGQPVG